MYEILIILAIIAWFFSRNPELTEKLKKSISEAFSGGGKGGRGRRGNIVDQPNWSDVEDEDNESGGDNAFGADGEGSSGQNGARGQAGGKQAAYGGNGRRTPNLQPLKRIVAAVFVILVLGSVAMGSYYNVSEQENAVVTMFGKVVRTDTAGLHFKLPLIQRVRMVDITTHGTGLGYKVNNDGQSFASDSDGVMITKDFNFINIDFYMEYKVNDPVAYLYNSREPEQILKNIALASIRSTVINFNVDDAITIGKGQIQSEVKEKIAEELADRNIGLSIVNITVQDAQPPTQEIIQAFKAVETAKQGKDTAVNNANKYKNEQVPAAEAQADRIRQNAEAAKASRIAEAEGQVARFNAMYSQYQLNPLITKQRMFYETMEDVLPGLKVIITDGKTQQILPLESFSGNADGAAGTGSGTGAGNAGGTGAGSAGSSTGAAGN